VYLPHWMSSKTPFRSPRTMGPGCAFEFVVCVADAVPAAACDEMEVLLMRLLSRG